MAGANTNIQVTDLDFNLIKNNFKNYLQSQDVFKDYNFDGSALSTLLDVLAYNTQYNAFYLNMVANEMFLDTALQRNSVVSHAKLLDYIPKSNIAPTAIINLQVNQVTDTSLTLPKFTSFLSESIDGVNYNFVTTDSYTVNTTNGTVVYNNLPIKQGLATTQSFIVDSTSNPNYLFQIPDAGVDTTSLLVTVQQSSSNSSYQVYTLASNYLELTNTSLVYFLQEGNTGYYQIYFGDGILGNQLSDGNVVNISYVVTQGTAAAGANNFVLMNAIQGATSSYGNTVIYPVVQASQGGNKESINSIKFQAPKSYSAQGRAVTINDYITLIQQNQLGISFDAVNVWGGETNVPPVYGKVFVCLKPTGGYLLTETQKTQILSDLIQPISVLTVTPQIVDPDYTYIQLALSVYYNPKLTVQTSSQIQNSTVSATQNWASSTLNTFNSTFNAYSLLSAVQSVDPSIVTTDYKLKLQKKFYPTFGTAENYVLNFNTPLQRGTFSSGITSYPGLQFISPTSASTIISDVFIEEVLTETYGVESVSITNGGFNYQLSPTVTIIGDGTGATATASITNGLLTAINVTNSGNNYTSAIVQITKQPTDTTGTGGAAVVVLQGQYGTLRSYYYSTTASGTVKVILNPNIGTIDYYNGIVTLTQIDPYAINNPLGELTITAIPSSSQISSTFNGIVTLDPFDPTSVSVNVIAVA
jgi:hypothetical protein